MSGDHLDTSDSESLALHIRCTKIGLNIVKVVNDLLQQAFQSCFSVESVFEKQNNTFIATYNGCNSYCYLHCPHASNPASAKQQDNQFGERKKIWFLLFFNNEFELVQIGLSGTRCMNSIYVAVIKYDDLCLSSLLGYIIKSGIVMRFLLQENTGTKRKYKKFINKVQFL